MLDNYTFKIIPVDCFDFDFKEREALFNNTVFYSMFLTTKEFMIDFGSDKNPELIKYASENDIPCKAYRTGGGTVVMTPDEAALMVLFPDGVKASEVVPFLRKQIIGFFNEIAGDHIITEDHNDILMDGFKVSSFSYNQVGYVQMFNFNVDENLLSLLPLEKPRIKPPKGLIELTGKTKEDLLAYLKRVLEDRNFIE